MRRFRCASGVTACGNSGPGTTLRVWFILKRTRPLCPAPVAPSGGGAELSEAGRLLRQHTTNQGCPFFRQGSRHGQRSVQQLWNQQVAKIPQVHTHSQLSYMLHCIVEITVWIY